MDRIQKFFLKLDNNKRLIFLKIFQDIEVLNIKKYDIKKLQGLEGVFRLRKGNVRIIFVKQNKKGFILSVNFRKEAYKK